MADMITIDDVVGGWGKLVSTVDELEDEAAILADDVNGLGEDVNNLETRLDQLERRLATLTHPSAEDGLAGVEQAVGTLEQVVEKITLTRPVIVGDDDHDMGFWMATELRLRIPGGYLEISNAVDWHLFHLNEELETEEHIGQYRTCDGAMEAAEAWLANRGAE